ncbi:MAG: hypothetical protein WBL28_04560 [Methylotenera sp.]
MLALLLIVTQSSSFGLSTITNVATSSVKLAGGKRLSALLCHGTFPFTDKKKADAISAGDRQVWLSLLSATNDRLTIMPIADTNA